MFAAPGPAESTRHRPSCSSGAIGPFRTVLEVEWCGIFRIDQERGNVASRDEYRAAAQRYTKMAAEARDPEIARLLRILADECLLELAGEGSAQQQQQIQPKDQKDAGK